MTLLLVVAALLLDQLLAEPKRWHPLVGFGRLADSIEHLLNRGGYRYLKGLLALLLVVAPLAWLAHWLSQQFGL
ncbi:MAG: cobalamin biosynthesis protein, partial [Chromatiales bacterium]|nr:cobalamin biosynthesis protein [Chromatiales bacterium]